MRKKYTTILNALWSSPENIAAYAKILKLLDPPTLNSLALGSVFMSMTDHGQDDLKNILLDQLVKLIISNKVKTPTFVLSSLQPLLKTVTHEDFKAKLLPPMLKAMLRNPEMVLSSIGKKQKTCLWPRFQRSLFFRCSLWSPGNFIVLQGATELGWQGGH